MADLKSAGFLKHSICADAIPEPIESDVGKYRMNGFDGLRDGIGNQP